MALAEVSCDPKVEKADEEEKRKITEQLKAAIKKMGGEEEHEKVQRKFGEQLRQAAKKSRPQEGE